MIAALLIRDNELSLITDIQGYDYNYSVYTKSLNHLLTTV